MSVEIPFGDGTSMLSTLMNYRLQAGDMTKTLARVGAQASVQREAQYYQENIGKVRTADDLVGDFRLYSYALKAHGLSEQIASPAFVRKILESDLSDPNSFANRLTDKRYRNFAAAFDFQAAGARTSIQSQAQTDRLVEAYSEHILRGGAIAAHKASAFQMRVAEVTTVDEFLADPALVEATAKIAGLDPALVSRDYLKGLLLGQVPSGQTLPEGLRFLSENFSFDADGGAAADGKVQTAAQTAAFVTRYFAAMGQGASSQAASFEARHFETAVLGAATADDLVKDPTIFRVLRIAAGLPDGEEGRAAVMAVLSKPADDLENPIARLTGTDAATVERREKLLALKATFDLTNGVGTAPATDPDRIARLLEGFFNGYPKADDPLIEMRTDAFRSQLTGMKSVSDLIGRNPTSGKAAFNYIMKAFDLDPAFESLSKIRQVLTSDPSDPNSFVRKLNDERYEKLAAAFNFGPDGKPQPERLAQSVRAQQETASLYAASFGADQSEDQKTEIRKATLAYLEGVGDARSLDALLSDRKTLDFALKARGLDPKELSANDLRRLLTSDLSDPGSFARSFNDKRYTDFAGSFNFTSEGRIEPSGGRVQGSASLLTTQNLYVLQMLEEEVGQTSEGTRLALYFLRKSPEVTTAFSILADKALVEVVRTALGLPQQFSQLDIDRQAAILESRLDFSDFKDPKKLDKFISRFSALYDMNNAPAGGSDPILALFGGGSSSGGIVGLF